MVEKLSLVFTDRSPLEYRMETSLTLLHSSEQYALGYLCLRTHHRGCDVPFTAVILPSLQSMPPLPYSESLNTKNTISSRMGNLQFFKHLFGLRSSIWIFSINIPYHSQYNSQFLSSRAVRFEDMSSLIPEPSKEG